MPKADDVGERIHFASEFAGGVGHSRDAAVETIQEKRQADSFGRNFEVMLGAGGTVMRGHSALQGLHHRNEAEKNVSGREESRQSIGGARRTVIGRARVNEPPLEIQP